MKIQLREKEMDQKKQLKISLPIAFEYLVNIFMTLVDTIAVSLIGTKELGAIGAMSVIINIMQMSIQTINVTNTALVAKELGEKNEDKIKLVSGNSLILTIIISIITILIIVLIKPIFPALFNVDAICNTYLAIRLMGFIQSSIVTVLSGQQRTLGKQGNILVLRILAVICNLILDILVVKLGYGIEGVAFVTIAIDTILAIYLLIKSNKSIQYKLNIPIIKNIFNLFKWNFVERIVTRVDNFVFNILVSRMGELEYAVHVILIQIKDIEEAFIQGFGDGITISVGVASGKKQKEYMQQIKQIAKKVITKVSIIIPIVVLGIALVVMYISLRTSELQRIYYTVLPILLIATYVNITATYYFSIIRGIRDFKFLAQRNFVSSLIKIIIAIILAYTPLGIIGVWLSYLVYNLVQKYMSKNQLQKKEKYEEGVTNESNCEI